MKNPLDILGNIFGGRGGGIGSSGGGYRWEEWAGDPQWQERQRKMMNQSAQEAQLAAQQAERYYRGMQGQQQGQVGGLMGSMIPPRSPELDPEHRVTQALVLLFGDHWEIINEELKRLEVDTPMRPLPRIGSPMW